MHRESKLALVPGGAQKHVLMTAMLLRGPRDHAAAAALEPRGAAWASRKTVEAHPFPSAPARQAGSEPSVHVKNAQRSEPPSLFLWGKEERFSTAFLHL